VDRTDPDTIRVQYSAWLDEKDVSKLTGEIISSFLEHSSKKQTDLIEAYRTALDPRQWKEDRLQMMDKAVAEAVHHSEAYKSDKGKNDNLESGRNTDSTKSPIKKASPRKCPFNTGDIVLGKVGGYLTWPGWVRIVVPGFCPCVSHEVPPPDHSS